MASKRKRKAAEIPGPIRVTLPISVAYDLDKFQQALANLAQLAGCRAGRRAVSCRREFVIDPASLQVREPAAQT